MPTPTQRRLKLKRLIVVVVALVATGGALFGLHRIQVQRQAGSLVERAEAAGAAGDWAAAANLYQTYLNFRPKDADALARYAAALEELAKTKPATIPALTKVYERLLELEPNRADDRRRLARHYVAVRYYSGARSHLGTLLAAGPDADLYELYAACEEGERKFPQAADSLRKAIATGKAAPEASLRLALVLRDGVRTPEAELEADQALNKLVQANPNDPRPRLLRAHYRTKAGRPDLAREDIEYAYRNVPGGATNPEIVLTLASIATTPDELRTARDALARTADAHPGDVRLRLGLAELQTRARDTDAARRNFAEAARQIAKPDGQLLLVADRLTDLGDHAAAATIGARFTGDWQYAADYLAGRARLADGDWPAAHRHLAKAIVGQLSQFPTQYVKAHLALADCHGLANDPDERLKAIEAVLAVEPGSVPARLGKADLLTRAGRFPEAAQLYQPLADLDKHPTARLELARLRLVLARGRPVGDASWTAFEDALGAEPLTAELALLKATSLFLRQRPADAVAVIEKLATDWPADPTARVALAASRASQGTPAALAVLDQATKDLGDRVEFRLARAQLHAIGANPDPTVVAALGENVGAFTPADRVRLAQGLGELLFALGRPKEATDEFRRAAAAAPNDLAVRVVLFDLAAVTKDDALVQQVLADFDRIEGPGGPTRAVAEVSVQLRGVKPGDAERVGALRGRTLAAKAKRANWGRVYAVLGDLDVLGGNPDGAVDHYRRAVRLGERSPQLVGNLARLLVARQGHAEALALLTESSRTMPLTADSARQLTLLRAMYGDAGSGVAWARAAANSTNPQDHLARAAVFAAGNALGEARTALEQAVASPNAPPDAWVALVRLHVAADRAKEAAAVTDEAAKRLGAGPTADAVLGACRELTGAAARAEEHYRRAWAALPTDAGTSQQLVGFLTRTSRRPEAEALLTKLIAGDAAAPVRRWARRALAFSKVGHPDGYAELPAALTLIETNLAEGGNLLDDQRAKAIVQALDPFQRADAVALLTSTAQGVPLSPEQNYHLARMHLLQGRADLAEAALADATRAAAVAAPEHLALLARVQVQRDNLIGARQTVGRLKAMAPQSWEAVSEEARVLAAAGNKPDAGRLVLGWPGAADVGVLAGVVGPHLEELGCPDAEKAFAEAAGRGRPPTAHVVLCSYYLRAGRAADALALARKHEATAPVGVTAKLLAGAARSRPFALVPEPERAGWTSATQAAEGWVRAKLDADPTNPDLLAAMAGFDDLHGRYDDEVRRYELALRGAPDNEGVHNNLALVLALHNRDGGDRPMGHVTKAMSRRGPRPTFLDTRAVVHTAGGRYAEAVRDLTVAVGLDPRPAYYFHLAVAYDRWSDTKPEAQRGRDGAVREATARGLKKEMLHPKEWADFDRLTRK